MLQLQTQYLSLYTEQNIVRLNEYKINCKKETEWFISNMEKCKEPNKCTIFTEMKI